MRKNLLLTIAMLVCASAFSQTRTTFVNEHFDGSSMPTGWYVAGDGFDNWIVYNSSQAGGQANELVFMWYPIFDGTSRLVMPAVDLTGVSSVMVSMKYALDNNSGSSAIGIATSSDGGSTWNDAWSQTFDADVQSTVNEMVSTPDMGNANVLFCLYFTGNSYNVFDWFFDDIEIYSVENADLSLQAIDMNPMAIAGDKYVTCTVANKGASVINEVTMSYQFQGTERVEETFDVTLLPSDSTQLTFVQPTNLYPGIYPLTVNIETVNGVVDDDPQNNTLSKDINIIRAGVQRIPMIEHFSSSTCNPCVNVNTQMQYLTDNNPGKFTYTKYQMNWPGAGDPYFTDECLTRSIYYAIDGVPQVTLDGVLQEPSLPISQIQLDNEYNMPSDAEVKGSFSVDGNTITVKVDFMSIEGLSAKAFVSVNEKVTYNNAMTNGETEFHHVFMKFLTDEDGDEISIAAGEYQHVEFTCDLSSTHIEEMSDLEVAAWIQYENSHRIVNSRYLYEYSDIHPYPVRSLTFAKVSDQSFKAQWEAPEGGQALSYNVYLGGECIANTTELEYEISANEGIHVLAVEAIYANDMTSVKMFRIYDPTESVDEQQVIAYDIYPNPNNGQFSIALPETECEIVVVNSMGQVLHQGTARGLTTLQLESLSSGVYFVNVKSDQMAATMKFVKEP